jgi:hypothetical protein
MLTIHHGTGTNDGESKNQHQGKEVRIQETSGEEAGGATEAVELAAVEAANAQPDAGSIRLDHAHRPGQQQPRCDESVGRQGAGLEIQASHVDA